MDMDLEMQYQKLPETLLPWYQANARDLPWRRDTEPYHVWLSEIMLQQTRVEAVRDYYSRFLEALPTIQALADVTESRLLKLWEGLGYYSRARNLQKAARQIVLERDGVFPETYEEILALPGVGPYTAGAIASICFEAPVAAVDGNVLRVVSRITEDHTPVDLPAARQGIKERLEAVYPRGACGTFTQALMELGATVCTPKSPKCGACPAAGLCLAHAHGTASQLPVRLPKREKRMELRTVFLFTCDGKLALERRTDGGLLSGLWQLPNVSGQLTPEEALLQAETMGVHPAELCQEVHKTHVFTHIRWEMVCYHIPCKVPISRYCWATTEELRTKYALPTAFRIFLDGQPVRRGGDANL